MALIILAVTFTLATSKISAECLSSQDVCEFTFTIEERLTMAWKNVRVKAANGTLYRFDESPADIKTKVCIQFISYTKWYSHFA